MRTTRLRMVDGRPAVRAATTAPLDADAALTELYTAHYPGLVHLAAALLDDPALAEEVAQDAYVRMHASWGRLRDQDAALAYLRRTVVNLAHSRLRRRRVAERQPPAWFPDEPSAEYGALDRLDRAAVVAALDGLPRRQRETLVLRYWADLSGAEIAALLGISEGAVKSHASRAMAALRARMSEQEVDR